MPNRASLARLILTVMAITALPHAQEPSSPKLAFEVASVKPNKSGAAGQSLQEQPGGRLTMVNFTLAQIIRGAYDVTQAQLKDPPGWINTERFDIVATVGATLKAES